MNNYIRLLRPNNWIKNFIIFSPLFFAGEIHNIVLLQNSLVAFVSFSFLASSIYILNDTIDIEHDRMHPIKKNRPLASGEISIIHASILGISLLILGLGLIYRISVNGFYISLLYIGIMIGYCLLFRKIALLDIGIIALGFVIRLTIGSTVTGIPNSNWIIIMTFLLALFIALAKRRDDLLIPFLIDDKIRESLNGYNLSLVNSLITVLVPIIIVSYLLYCTADENMVRVGKNLYITTIFVLCGFMRYLQLVYVNNLGGDPIKLLTKDKSMQLIMVIWLASFTSILYF